QVDVVVAARGRSDADERAPGEECGGRVLQPQPGMADRTGHDVEEDAQGKAADADPAQDHQPGLQRVQSFPFQMAVALEDRRSICGKIGNACHVRRRLASHRWDYFTARTRPRSLTVCGPSSLASSSWMRAAASMTPDLSTVELIS